MRNKVLLTGLSFLLLGGCTMMPKYHRPDAPVPAAWSGNAAAKADKVAAPAAADLAWNEFFTDAKMRSVIETALAENRDLRVASLNVEKVRQVYGIQRAGLLPKAGISAGADNYRMPDRMSSTGSAYTVEQYSVMGTASWEIDLFGRIRSLKAKALNQYLATEEARKASRISLTAAVAESYLTLAADRESLRLAESTLEAQQKYYELILKSRDAGVASDLALRQSQSQVEAARVDVARYSGIVETDRNALTLLVGKPLTDDMLPDGLDTVGEMKDVSAGLDSTVLLSRPDILAAEYQLKGANANIGAARAAFFPTISLTGAAGTLSPALSKLFAAGTGYWNYSPSITTPIFAGGSLVANLKIAKADRDIAVAQYEKAIQSAFREVSDALARRTALKDQIEAQNSLVSALEESYRLSDARYKAGIDNYLGVLVSQRSLYDAQRGLVSTRLARQANKVALFRVLGGSI